MPSTAFLNKISESGLTSADAKKLKLKELTGKQAAILTENKFKNEVLQIPYFELNGKTNCFWRARRLDNPKSFRKKLQRYTQPVNAIPRAYFPPLLTISWEKIKEDTTIPVFITEGELKAAAGCKFLKEPVMALGGVWNWKSKKAHQTIIKDIRDFKWEGRTTYLVFDSDSATNSNVQKALDAFATSLINFGAYVFIISLPQVADNKVGLDDYLVEHGVNNFEQLIDDAQPYNYCKALFELNKKIYFCKSPYTIIEKKSKNFYTIDNSKVIFAPEKVYRLNAQDQPKPAKAILHWLEWPCRAEVDTIEYAPGKGEILVTEKGMVAFNTWQGWGCEPKAGDIKPWVDMMRYVFGNNRKARKWFEQWCAYQFQNPGKKMYSGVLMWGVETGTGKSMIGLTLGKIFGTNFSEVGQKQLHSDYNPWAANKQFILGDEITGVTKRADADSLKNMITQTRIEVNIKYVPNYEIDDCINYYFTSNHPDAFILEDKDRRFFVWEMPSERLQRKDYTKYDKWLHGTGPSHLFHYFLNKVSLAGFDPKEPPIMTEAKKEMTMVGKSDVALFAYDLMNNPDSILKVDNVKITGDIITNEAVEILYNSLHQNKSLNNKNALSRELTRAGFPKSYTATIDNKTYRLRIVRNIKKWLSANNAERNQHFREHFLDKKQKKY